jgi:hypothetical protein
VCGVCAIANFNAVLSSGKGGIVGSWREELAARQDAENGYAIPGFDAGD